MLVSFDFFSGTELNSFTYLSVVQLCCVSCQTWW